jgi:UbiD family decarboxylase
MRTVTDMREYIQCLEEMGEIKKFDGADLKIEVGALTERAAEKEGPALLFGGFAGYPPGFRIISNAFRTCRRTAPAMGLPEARPAAAGRGRTRLRKSDGRRRRRSL